MRTGKPKGYPAWNKGTRGAMGLENKHPNWKKEVGYAGIHRWVYRNFGKATKCENKFCEEYPRLNSKGVVLGYPKRFNWCSISGKYKRDKKDWKQLCPSCHQKFDRGYLKIKFI